MKSRKEVFKSLLKEENPWFELKVPDAAAEAMVLRLRYNVFQGKLFAFAVKFITIEGLLVFALSSVAL